jgi:hypothetical protein
MAVLLGSCGAPEPPAAGVVLGSAAPAPTPLILVQPPDASPAVVAPEAAIGTLPPAPTPLPTLPQIGPENAAALQQLQYLGEGVIGGVAWAPDGTTIAVAGSSGIYLYDPATLDERRFIATGPMRSNLAFSPDGKTLAIGGLSFTSEDSVELWDVQSGQRLHRLNGAIGDMSSVVFSPDGRVLASAARDNPPLGYRERPAPEGARRAYARCCERRIQSRRECAGLRERRRLSAPVGRVALTPGSISAIIHCKTG